MKKFLTVFVFMICVYNGNAQINPMSQGNGKYQFVSEYPSEDLHFYLFGDGHHSFEQNPQHHFGNNMNPASVYFYHTNPYEDDEPIDDFVVNVYDGVLDPSAPVYTLDNKITVKRSWNFVNGQDDFIILSFQNNEQSLKSGCIEFHYNAADTPILANEILDDYSNDWVDYDASGTSVYSGYTHYFSWNYENMKPGEQRHIYLPANCLAGSMSKLKHLAIMNDVCGEPINIDHSNDGSNPLIANSNYYTLKSVVSNNPHDPNCIVQDPNCLNKDLPYHPVRYKVYFQNEGVDPAINVLLDYQLKAPFLNLELVDSSDPCSFNYTNTGTGPSGTSDNAFTILFGNIMLPGLNSPTNPDYEKTIGWVEFRVCYDLSLFDHDLDCVDSEVDIYFDNEPAVTAKNSICKKEPCHYTPTIPEMSFCNQPFNENQSIGGTNIGNAQIVLPNVQQSDSEEYGFYPNPVDNLMILEGNIDNIKYVHIVNSQGQNIISQKQGEILKEIDLSFIPSGLYYISISTQNNSVVKKFVKL